MMSKFGRFVLVGLALGAGPVMAQESSSVVEVKSDWSVFAEPDPKQCWAVTAPSASVATRDGQPVDVRRGEVQMFVTFRPADGVAGEVSFTGGYPFDKNAPLSVSVDGQDFALTTAEGSEEWAWAATEADQSAMLAAMKKGAEAVVTAQSARGTQTKDTFSLRGFTAAMDEAAKRCQ